LNLSVLELISVFGLLRNTKLADIIQDAEDSKENCICGNIGVAECINCEKVVCSSCRPRHQHHCLVPCSDNCPDHFLPKFFYCENDRIALCEICTIHHLGSSHLVLHKDEILIKYWYSIYDLSQNKQEIFCICSKIPEFYYKITEILSFNPRNWIETVSQILDIKDIEINAEKDIINFQVPSNSICRNLIESLSSFPVALSEYNTIAYLARGSHDLITYKFRENSFNFLKVNKFVLKWSGVLRINDTEILITGGKQSKNSGAVPHCFKINLESGEAIEVPDMIYAHSSHVILKYFNQVFVISGKNSDNSVSSFCEILDLPTSHWTAIANCITPRTCASGAVVEPNIYITGGCKNNTIEKYSIKDNIWVLLDVLLPDYIWQHSSIEVDNNILIFGGEGLNDEPNRTSYIFNTSDFTFSKFQELPVGASWLCGWYFSLIRGKRIWIMNKEQKFLCYNMITETWSLYKKQYDSNNSIL
jgi:hypothetical protein